MSAAHFTHNTTPLFYTRHGPPTSPPILLLHGWLCDQLDWSFQLPPLLSLGFHVIALDLRGHGRSQPAPPSSPPSLYSPSVLAADAAALLSHLGFAQPALIMGHSLGALVAAIVAVRHPQLVRGLVLVDAAWHVTGETAAPMLAALRGSEVEKVAETVVAGWGAGNGGIYNERTPGWVKAMQKMRALGVRGEVVVKAGEELYGVGEGVGRWEDARGFFRRGWEGRGPVLSVLSGEWMVGMEREMGLDGKVVGDRVVVVDEGHWLHVQGAEQFNGILEEWLRDVEFMP